MILSDTATVFYELLSGGTALTSLLPGTASVYHMQAPDDATLPYVVFSHQAGGPENMTSQGLERNIWYVRAYGTSAMHAESIFHQADGILNKADLPLDYHHAINCWRIQNIQLVENTPSGKVWNSGGLYEVRSSTPSYTYGTVSLTDDDFVLLTG